METEVKEEANWIENQMTDYLDTQILSDVFNRIKNLFNDAPLSRKDLHAINTIPELFLALHNYKKIFLGNYGFFTKRLKTVNPRLGTYVDQKETEIKLMLNEGTRDCLQESTGVDSHSTGHIQPPQEVVPEQETGHTQLVREVVPVKETDGGTAGNFHKSENATLSHSTIEAMGIPGLRKSIGLITLKKDGCLLESTTGFRVGKNYLMTAYHVFKEIIKIVWERILKKAEQSDKKESVKKKLQDLFGFQSGYLNPRKQPLPFGQLFEFLKDHEVQIEVFDKLFRQATKVMFGIRDGKTTAGEFRFEYDIPFADVDHDVIVLKMQTGESIPPPPLQLEKDSVRDIVHLIGYPKGQTEVDLRSDIKCSVYVDDQGLRSDVTKAIKWWEDHRNRSVHGDYAVCRYGDGMNCTVTGKMFLHTSKEFERRSSGSPAVAIIDDRCVVQMMYLRGYPEFCYKDKNFPPPQYLFEAGVAMPVITRLLIDCCPEVLED
ncbi:uncharacterized protein [Argopecten irradians]|uniref:uncharacterized protein n=1 Tax=Argopecten irradians TaxID=31199 RepID=UPI0037176225